MENDGVCRRRAAVGLGVLLCSAWVVAGCGKAVYGPLVASGETPERRAQTQPGGGAPIIARDPPTVPATADPAIDSGVTLPEVSTARADESADEPQILITNQWLGTPVRDILDDVAFNSGIQLFVSDTGVRGSLSISVEDMPFEQFLARISSIRPGFARQTLA